MARAGRQPPPLIPAPAEFHYGSDSDAFSFDAEIPIQLGIEAGQETLFAAQQLQASVHDATGLRPALRKTANPGQVRGVALLLVGREPGEVPIDGGPEAYALRITSLAITIAANAEAGLFYGVQTLKQL